MRRPHKEFMLRTNFTTRCIAYSFGFSLSVLHHFLFAPKSKIKKASMTIASIVIEAFFVVLVKNFSHIPTWDKLARIICYNKTVPDRDMQTLIVATQKEKEGDCPSFSFYGFFLARIGTNFPRKHKKIL